MSGYNEQHATTMLNALQGTETLERFKQKIKVEVIYEIKKILPPIYCNNCNQIACDGGRVGSIQECASVRLLIDILGELEEQLKGQK